MSVPHSAHTAAVHALEQDGMTYEVLQAGDTSSPLPQRAQQAVVDYTLWIEKFEGKQIDTSKGTTFPPKLPSPFTFAVGVGSVVAARRVVVVVVVAIVTAAVAVVVVVAGVVGVVVLVVVVGVGVAVVVFVGVVVVGVLAVVDISVGVCAGVGV